MDILSFATFFHSSVMCIPIYRAWKKACNKINFLNEFWLDAMADISSSAQFLPTIMVLGNFFFQYT